MKVKRSWGNAGWGENGSNHAVTLGWRSWAVRFEGYVDIPSEYFISGECVEERKNMGNTEGGRRNFFFHRSEQEKKTGGLSVLTGGRIPMSQEGKGEKQKGGLLCEQKKRYGRTNARAEKRGRRYQKKEVKKLFKSFERGKG